MGGAVVHRQSTLAKEERKMPDSDVEELVEVDLEEDGEEGEAAASEVAEEPPKEETVEPVVVAKVGVAVAIASNVDW